METLKPIQSICGRTALLATAFLIAPLAAREPRAASGFLDREVSRRALAIEEAQVLLNKGDEAYTSGRYPEAVEAYSGARELIPDAPVSAELRTAATERYAQASVEHARVLSRKGNIAQAKIVLDKVLEKSVAPNHPGTLDFRAQLDDPIRTNPALAPEHGKDIDTVRRGLYTAEGAYQLGKFDDANATYQQVLLTDPTNKAARRGMEKVAAAKSDYLKSAYDHTRADMLSQVDQQWELKQLELEPDASLSDNGSGLIDGELIAVKNKIDRIIIPKIALDQSSLQEAIDFLRLQARKYDELEPDPNRKGVNFNLNLGAADSPESKRVGDLRFDLQLTNVPLSQVLIYLGDITRTSFNTDDFSVNITPLDSISEELVTRTYRVPPDFISSMSNGASAETTAAADPFAEAPASTGLLATRLGAQEALTQQGVTFGKDASATYLAATNTLRVVNTPTNQDYISQIIETISRAEPVIVSVSLTMIKVQQTQLEELGFDWLLDNFGFGGPGKVGGSSELNLSGGTAGSSTSLDDIVLPLGATNRNPITAGNRSGDDAISGNATNSLINKPSGRQVKNRAPGIFGVRGNLSNVGVQMLMRGLDQKKGVDLMAKPSITTRSGQSSSISIVRKFIYPTEYEPPKLPNEVDSFSGGGAIPVTPATPTAFETKDVGITLEVLPVVDANKQYITVTLNPVFSDFDGFVNYGSPINSTASGLLGNTETVTITENAILMPVFSKQSVSSTVDVADGATVVVGGLLQESIQNVEDQVPILGSIPIVGKLFQSKARQPTSTAIIFLVNVQLMDPAGRPYLDR